MDIAIICFYYIVLLILAVYGVHRFHLVRLVKLRKIIAEAPIPTAWPAVTVQLPVFNEPEVVERLLEAAAAMQYPAELDIQLLDDSTDATTQIAAGKIENLRRRGVRVSHLRRGDRTGFKAGALAAGMEASRAPLLAVFDSDFVPPADFLLNVVPFFCRKEIGMVQVRWSHLNAAQSLLTSVQAVYLDAHFAVESTARSASGRFLNFNGTAGVWRREAIEGAGGWSASTLTEDLDLSYRAQMAGWRFLFLPDVEVPAELPATLAGFHDQQHRWAKGSLQTARKLLPSILRSTLPTKVKTEAFFHLTSNMAYLLTLLLALFIVPSLLIRQRLGLQWLILFDLVLFASSTLSIFAFYFEGQRRVGRSRPGWKTSIGLLVIGVGMSVRNAAAAVEGLVQRGGFFQRTPKQGGGSKAAHADQSPRIPLGETILFGYFAVVVVIFAMTGQLMALPFVLLFLAGYGYVAFRGILEAWRFRLDAGQKALFDNDLAYDFDGVRIAE